MHGKSTILCVSFHDHTRGYLIYGYIQLVKGTSTILCESFHDHTRGYLIQWCLLLANCTDTIRCEYFHTYKCISLVLGYLLLVNGTSTILGEYFLCYIWVTYGIHGCFHLVNGTCTIPCWCFNYLPQVNLLSVGEKYLNHAMLVLPLLPTAYSDTWTLSVGE